MKLLRGTQLPAECAQGVVATVGNFDGVHLGHQHLIAALREKARALNLPLVIMTFEPQPREYFHQDKAPARLSSLREKIDVLRLCQVDFLYCFKFQETLAQKSASDFAEIDLFALLKVKYLLVGEDFRFGKNREGDVALLKRLGHAAGCVVETFADRCVASQRVSSTAVRAALQAGDLTLAATYLGRTFSLCGRVARGDGRGRQWGIPTANLNLHHRILPLSGVYVVTVLIQGVFFQAVANVGKRPTVDGVKHILEVHLFDFDRSIYGQLIQVFFLHKLRDEVKFTSVEALIEQIHDDVAVAKSFYLQENHQKLIHFAQ